MKEISRMVLLLTAISVTAASDNGSTTDATPTDGHLAASINQNEPVDMAACFPFCDPQLGKREDLSRAEQAIPWSAAQMVQGEQATRETHRLHPKFLRWLIAQDGTLSSSANPRLIVRKRQQQMGTERGWKRTWSRDYPNYDERMTSYKRGG